MTRFRGRQAAALLLGGLIALAASSPAAAEPAGVVKSVVPTQHGIDVEFLLTGLSADDRAVLESVRVELDGEPVRGEASPLVRDGAADPGARRVALVVDVSGSMAGPRLEAARAAVNAYLTTVPDDVQVGLVTFSGRPVVATPLSPDRAPVLRTVQGLAANGGTSLYDAVLTARDLLGSQGERRMVILSDGEDSSSTATLDAATGELESSHVNVEAVLLGEDATGLSALTRLAEAGRGRVLSADDSGDAVAAFTSAAQVFSEGLKIDVTPPPRAEGLATLTVQASTAKGQILTGSHTVLLPDIAVAAGEGLLASRTALVAGLLAVFAGLATALTVAVSTGDRRAVGRRRTHALLAAYGTAARGADEPAPETSRLGSGTAVTAATALAARLLRGEREARLGARLERAAIKLLPKEWVVLQSVLGLLALLVAYLLSGLFLGLLGLTVALVGGHVWLNLKGARRQAAFLAEMPDALQLVASGLASGYSFPQAIDSVVREGRQPVAEEFGRALAEARLGVPLEDALENVANRMDSQDFHWVVMAIRVQRDVGGNLSEVLQTVCNTMRERSALRRQVKALSAEGRLSAVVLVLLPVLVGGYLALMNPVFFAPMLNTSVGLALLGFCAVSMTIGGLWMKKLVKVEM